MRNPKNITAVIAAAAALATSLASGSANAWYSRLGAGECQSDLAWQALDVGGRAFNFATPSTYLGTAIDLYCPIPDTNSQPRTSIATVAAELIDQSTTQASCSSVCISDSDTMDVECAPSSRPCTSNGSNTQGFSGASLPTHWTTIDGNHEYYHAYLWVTLGLTDSSGNRQFLTGYWTSS